MSEKLKFTQHSVKNLQLSDNTKQSDFWDTDQAGFGIRVGAKSKTFFVASRVKGRMVRSTVGKFPAMNVDDARKRARHMLVDMLDGVNPNDAKKDIGKPSLTLGAVFTSYLSTRKGLSEGTASVYRGTFDRHLSLWKNRSVDEISSQMVVDHHLAIGTSKGKNVANQSMRLLRAVMNFARSSYGVPKENPVAIMSQVRAWYKDGVRSNIIKAADMPLFFREVSALGNETVRDYLMLVIFTGLRRNEAMGLRWEDVDLESETLTVHGTKNGEDHTIPLSVHLIRLLAGRQDRWGKEGYVFPTWAKSGHLTNVQHALRDLRGKGLNFTLHDLRRTFITTAESLDISSYVVKRLANHKQTDITGKHYIVHDIDRLREPMRKISAALLDMGKGRAIP